MTASQEYIDDLVNNPRESPTVEIKNWIDPRSKHGQAKIVKAMIAMRNHNGGFLQIGLENATWIPDHANAPDDARSVWDTDEIQGLVTRYASDPFEVHVRFAMRDRQEFPVLEVEAGVRTPVAAKADLNDPDRPDRKLVEEHAVYIRSLSSNNTASSNKARHQDLAGLVERCFDNREADIGRFVRRQLGSMDPRTLHDLSGLFGRLSTPETPPEVDVEMFRRDGYERFQRQKIERNLLYQPQHGSWEVAAIASTVADGDMSASGPPTQRFLDLLGAANPGFTGWPMWMDSRSLPDRSERDSDTNLDPAPYVYDGGWEAFLYEYQPDSWYNHLDFWRVEPAGRFYQYRAFEDDLPEGEGYPPAMKELDFALVVVRVAEAMAVPLAFARAMGLATEETTVHYLFLWRGLSRRRLSTWSDRRRSLIGRYESRQDEARSPVIGIPLDTPDSALGPFVRRATSDLFASFGGFEAGEGVIEELTDRMLARNL